MPAEAKTAAQRFRYGRAEMQIHLALSRPVAWEGDERLGGTAIVHVTPGLDGVSRAVNEAERGLLPAEPTVVLGQPLTMDASRAPDGAGLLWVQLQELPRHIKGDAAGEIETGDGSWSESVRERYADRIQGILARHMPGLESAIVARTVLGPADLERENINLVGGDPTAARSRSTRTSCGGPTRHGTATPRPSSASGRSARAPTRARGWAAPPARWSRRRCCTSRGGSTASRMARAAKAARRS